MAQAMVIHGGSALEPANMNDVFALAKHAAESKFFGCKTVAEATMIILAGKDLGFTAAQSLRAFAVINNRPAMYSDGMVACVLGKPNVCEFFEEVESTDDASTWVTKRVGRPEKRFTFTKADAIKAKLWGKAGPWTEYPSTMLSHRAAAFLARRVYPDILMGFYSVDEALDIADSERARKQRNAPPQPAPVEYVVTGEPVVEHVAGAFAEAIADAATLDDLTSIAKRIKAASLNAEDRDALAAAYKARASELRGAA